MKSTFLGAVHHGVQFGCNFVVGVKPTEQYFPLKLFITLFKVYLNQFESVN